jgi:cytochrome b
MSKTHSMVIWDLPVRAFHWLTVVLVLACYVTWRLNWMDWHTWAGEALLALLIFRLLWGLFGSDTARFARFVATPTHALAHLRHLLRREPDRSIGHNPAGGWMVLVMLGLLIGQALSGLYINNDIADDGPFTELVAAPVANAISALHTIFWDLLLAAIGLHLLAILTYAAAKGHNLLRPMITGRKHFPEPLPPPHIGHSWLAVLLLAISSGATIAIASLL